MRRLYVLILIAITGFPLAGCGGGAPALTASTLTANSVLGGATVSAQQVPAQQVPAQAATAQPLRVPNRSGSVKFAVIGDSGTGGSDQKRVADQMIAYRGKFAYDFVIMLGDNLYGSERPSDYVSKFERPYKSLLDGGVKFYAALGNHDDPNQRLYKPFNMNGERYYTFRPSLISGVRFFALDSNYMDPQQLQWLDKELTASGADWKIAFFHHPIYSSGDRHGANTILRDQLEPLFVKHTVNVVFQGHEHFYERLKPQKGIAYFIAGGSAKLRTGDNTSPLTVKTFDTGFTFMIVEVAGDEMHFQTISDRGQTIDYGVVQKGSNDRVIGTSGTPKPDAAPAAKPEPAPKPAAKPEAAPKPAAKPEAAPKPDIR